MRTLGEILLEQHIITESQLQQAQSQMRVQMAPLERTLLDLNYVRESDLCRARAVQLRVQYQDLAEHSIPFDLKVLMPYSLCAKHEAVPVRLAGRKLWLAMNDVLNIRSIDDLGFATGKDIIPMLAERKAIADALKRNYLQEIHEVEPGEIHAESHSTLDDEDDHVEDWLETSQHVAF